MLGEWVLRELSGWSAEDELALQELDDLAVGHGFVVVRVDDLEESVDFVVKGIGMQHVHASHQLAELLFSDDSIVVDIDAFEQRVEAVQVLVVFLQLEVQDGFGELLHVQ